MTVPRLKSQNRVRSYRQNPKPCSSRHQKNTQETLILQRYFAKSPSLNRTALYIAGYAYAGRGAVDGGHDLRWSLRQKGRAGATFRNMDEPQQGGRTDVGVRAPFARASPLRFFPGRPCAMVRESTQLRAGTSSPVAMPALPSRHAGAQCACPRRAACSRTAVPAPPLATPPRSRGTR
jgi:hypothetical protein